MGRPSSFTQGVADMLCERLAEGESLRAICADDGMPRRATVFRWLAVNEMFRDQYAWAKEAQAETYADEIVAIADDRQGDYIERDGNVVYNAEHVNRSRLRVDARKWVASKLKPKKYGDRLDVESKGSLTITIQSGDAGFT